MDDNKLNEATIIYCFARTEQLLESFAKSFGVSASELTQQVAELLLAQTSRQTLGTQNSVSRMPGNRARKRQTVEQVEVDDTSHSNKTSLAGYKYKPGTHWTQRPENKARLRKQMRRVRQTRGYRR